MLKHQCDKDDPETGKVKDEGIKHDEGDKGRQRWATAVDDNNGGRSEAVDDDGSEDDVIGD